MEFLLPNCRRSSAQNVPSDEKRGETACFRIVACAVIHFSLLTVILYIPLIRVGLNILAADHQHFCFCPASPTATEENLVGQEDSPESIYRTIAHNRVLHSCACTV